MSAFKQTPILVLLGIFVSVCAQATVRLATTPVGGWQVNDTGTLAAGVTAMAHTSGNSLSIGAGFSVVCQGSFGSIDFSNGRSETRADDAFGFTLNVPLNPPGEYSVPLFKTWNSGEAHVCEFKYRGIATRGSFSIQGGGAGINFGIGLGEESLSQSGTIYFEMIRQELAECLGADFCCIP